MRADSILKWTTGPSVLDVGCAGHVPKPGSPYWLHGRLRETFDTVAGIDINEPNIALLRQAGYDDIYMASAESFNLGRKFDTIVAGEVIEHLANPGRFLDCCRDHLHPGGRVVISTPYVFSLIYVLYALLKYPNSCQNPEHTAWFCRRTISELSSRHGFAMEHFELIEDYEFDNASWKYLLFARFVTTLGRVLLPERLRNNNMLVVLADDSSLPSDTTA